MNPEDVIRGYLSQQNGLIQNQTKSDLNLVQQGGVPFVMPPSQKTQADVLKPITSRIPNWIVGNPIAPQGVNVSNLAHQLLGGSYSPDEASFVQKYYEGNLNLSPQELAAGKKLSQKDLTIIMGLTQSPTDISSIKGITSAARPQSQIDLENAWNNKDFGKAQQIIDSLDDLDPYKASMQDLQTTKVITQGKIMDLTDPQQYQRIVDDAIHTNPELFQRSFTSGNSYSAINDVLRDSLGKLGYQGVKTPEGVTVFGAAGMPDIKPDPYSLGSVQGKINDVLEKNKSLQTKEYLAPQNPMEAYKMGIK